VDAAAWRFLPSRLLQGRLAFAVDVKGAGFQARCEAGRALSGWNLRECAARADAALAAAALPLLGRWRPEGSFELGSKSIDVAGNDIRGDATLEWKAAATTLSEVRPLGSYRASLDADGPGANVTVTTLEGPLRLSGNGRLDWPARLNFMGEARGEGPRAAALAPLLDILGPARADGARTLDVRWR
jgi:general secretion pathway protein N